MDNHLQSSLMSLFSIAGKVVHLAVGIQQNNVQSGRMERVVDDLEDAARLLKDEGVDTYWCYSPEAGSKYAYSVDDLQTYDYKRAGAAIYKINPVAGDKVIPHSASSIFKRAVLEDKDIPSLGRTVLEQDGVRTLIVDGLFIEDPLMETVLDARKLGYNAILLEDLTDRPLDDHVTYRLQYAGVISANSADVIRAIAHARQLKL